MSEISEILLPALKEQAIRSKSFRCKELNAPNGHMSLGKDHEPQKLTPARVNTLIYSLVRSWGEDLGKPCQAHNPREP